MPGGMLVKVLSDASSITALTRSSNSTGSTITFFGIASNNPDRIAVRVRRNSFSGVSLAEDSFSEACFCEASGAISLPAAASGGAIIDFDAISEVAGAMAGISGAALAVPGAALAVPGATDATVVGLGAGSLTSARVFSTVAGAVVATGPISGGGFGLCTAACAAAAADIGTAPDAEAWAADGSGVGKLCRANAPVTDSSPCSTVVRRV